MKPRRLDELNPRGQSCVFSLSLFRGDKKAKIKRMTQGGGGYLISHSLASATNEMS